MTARSATLRGGLVMPLVGFNTWKIPASEVKMAVYQALSVGYRRIDSSWDSLNQKEVGDGIAQAIEEGIVQRVDLFMTSQFRNPIAEEVGSHLCETLNQLQCQNLDLLLIHVTDDLTPSDIQSWAAMETVLAQGLVKAIGVSNLNVKKLGEMLPSVNVLPVVGLGEMYPLLKQNELLEYCQSEEVHWIANGVFGSGEMAEPYDHARLSAHHNLLKNESVLRVAIEAKKTPAQVLIRWSLQRGTSVTLHTTNIDRQTENISVFDWELSVDHMQLLSQLEPQTRMLD